jgi:hypothetical protein
MINLKALKEQLIGSIRATEITQSIDANDKTILAHPHIHGLLLLRKDSDIPHLRALLGKYWRKAIKQQVRKHSDLAIDTSQSFQELKALSYHTSLDTHSWLRYMTKGGYDLERDDHLKAHSSNTDSFWQSADLAIKGMRLIATSGDLKECIALVKKHAPQMQLAELSSTHTWSNAQMKYVNSEDYDPNKEPPITLSNTLSYLPRGQHMSYLFANEYALHLAELEHHNMEHLTSTLLNTGNHSLLEHKKQLFINRHKIVDHYSEPDEVIRSSLVEKHEARQNHDKS